MSDYRPISDTWILARPKVKYYGAYPAGFLGRARALLGVNINEPVLHVCAGRVRDYPFTGQTTGIGPNDQTFDLDPETKPDTVGDAMNPEDWPKRRQRDGWPAILADPPYTLDDAARYAPGPSRFPDPNKLLGLCLEQVEPGGRVGMLHYVFPRPPRDGARLIACIGVIAGYGNRMRCYSVFERTA